MVVEEKVPDSSLSGPSRMFPEMTLFGEEGAVLSSLHVMTRKTFSSIKYAAKSLDARQREFLSTSRRLRELLPQYASFIIFDVCLP